ncbi:MAG: thioredoxin domain-containing protein [Candidatus Paceibacterota bacterium]
MEPQEQTSSSSVAIPIAIVFGFGLIALAIFFSGGNKSTVDDTPKVDESNLAVTGDIRPIDETDYIRGNPNAPILIVEYSDYDCPFCKSFHQTMNQIMNEYGVTGKVAWVYRQFPLAQLHPNAPRISEAALCVGELGGNDAFWKFSDQVFENRGVNELTNISNLANYAEESGVSKSDYEACVQSGRHEASVQASLRDGAQAGAGGTPHSFVLIGNQKAVIEGAQPYAVVKQIVEGLIAQLEGTDTGVLIVSEN